MLVKNLSDSCNMKKNCLIYNFGPHYRAGVFKAIDQNNRFDFYFGDRGYGVQENVKKIDYTILKNFKSELVNFTTIKPFYFQIGVISLLFKDYKKYVISTEYFCISTWIFLILSKIVNKKVFLWSHGWYGNEGTLKTIVKLIFFKLSDGIFLYGNHAKKLMIKKGFNKNKLHVIYNSLDTKKQLKYRLRCNKTNIFYEKFNNHDPVLCFIGRIHKQKKIEEIIQAIKMLKDKEDFFNLLVIGDGQEKEKLIDACKDLGIEQRCWFYGETYSEKEISNLIYNSFLCISPGNVGLTAVHSMNYGTPVFTNDDFENQGPEFESIIPFKTGNFFKKNDVGDMVNKIQEWFNNNYDRNEIRQQCFQIVDDYYNIDYQIKIINAIMDN